MIATMRQSRSALVLLITLLSASVSSAQLPDLWRAERMRASDELLRGSASGVAAPLEAPVDPGRYLLVPGDQLLLGIWGDSPESYRTVVTPDGHLVVPDLVAVDVRGLTLAEGANLVRRTLAPLYPREPIELHLLELGTFRVAITGAVAHPGLYETNGAERLSDLLLAAEGVRREGSLRRIRIRARDAGIAGLDSGPGGSLGREVDHALWYRTGESEANPHLRPGDVVEVPTLGSYVEIDGAIGGGPGILVDEVEARVEPNRPDDPGRIRIEWLPGDQLEDLLSMGGGLGSESSGRGILVAPDGNHEPVNFLDPVDLRREIPAFSRIEVEHTRRWVYVVGAVRAPGRYPFYSGLAPSDYVLLAGGETENGRTSDWKHVSPDGTTLDAADVVHLEPGSTLRVPERRSYWVSRVLAPLSSAAALTISILALTDRRN